MSPGASNFEVTLRFLENLCTPGLVTIPSTLSRIPLQSYATYNISGGHPVTDTL